MDSRRQWSGSFVHISSGLMAKNYFRNHLWSLSKETAARTPKLAWLSRKNGYGRVVRRYFLALLILICSALLISGLLEIFYNYQENLKYLGEIQQQVASSTSFKVEQFVTEIERTMRKATKTREIIRSGLSPAYEWELRRLLASTPAITRAIAFDLNGVEVAEASRLTPHKIRKELSPAAVDKAKTGKSYFGPAYYDGYFGPSMAIAVPIERFPGEIVGILLIRVDLKHILNLIAEIRVGKTGSVYVVSPNGDLVAHPDLSRVLQKPNLSQNGYVKTALRMASRGQTTQSAIVDNFLGEKVLASYTAIPTLGWTIFAEQPIAEIRGPLYASLLRTAGVLTAGLAIVFLATFSVRRRIILPLEKLRQGVDRLRQGKLNSRIDLKTGDEFQVLADEFDAMAASLEEAYSGLEYKVTERTGELIMANHQLEEASKHKSQFLANVNHELRTPLSAIIGYARLLRRETKGQISELQRENLEDLITNAEQLLGMIDTLLDLSRIEVGRMEVRKETVHIGRLIEGVASTIIPLLNGDRVQLTSDIAPDIPTLDSDPKLLRQIIVNLLANAAKYTHEGEIKVSVLQQEQTLHVTVSDTGIGIPQDELTTIFEEFHRGALPPTHGPEGSGLGLSIVKRYVELLGGDIEVASAEGKGSTFTVCLPLNTVQTTSI